MGNGQIDRKVYEIQRNRKNGKKEGRESRAEFVRERKSVNRWRLPAIGLHVGPTALIQYT